MTDHGKMDGKRVLVTGSGTGIGKGIALEFAERGAAVALHYSHSAAGAQEAVQEIAASGGKARAFAADFTKVDEVNRLAQEAVDFLGGMDVLVNNAGITVNLPFQQVTPEQFDTLYQVNVKAQFFLTQAVLPVMIEQKRGVVINVTSVHAYGGLREHSVYAGTKGAIVAYTRELGVELAPKGVRVNAIAPGWILVENQEKALGDDFDWEAAGRVLPAGFVGNPRDIGCLAVFLASDEARFIVGQTLIADGGQTAILPATGDFRQPMGVQFGRGYVPGVEQEGE